MPILIKKGKGHLDKVAHELTSNWSIESEFINSDNDLLLYADIIREKENENYLIC